MFWSFADCDEEIRDNTRAIKELLGPDNNFMHHVRNIRPCDIGIASVIEFRASDWEIFSLSPNDSLFEKLTE